MNRQRADKWLWHAHVVRTRTDAATLVAKGRVRVNGLRKTAPGYAVKVGDVLTIALNNRICVLKIAELTEPRGGAASARSLYEELQRPLK